MHSKVQTWEESKIHMQKESKLAFMFLLDKKKIHCELFLNKVQEVKSSLSKLGGVKLNGKLLQKVTSKRKKKLCKNWREPEEF